MPKLSVIIAAYNEEENIEHTLKSLINQTIPRNEYEIIIVDGNSKDKTREIAEKYADKVIIQKGKGVSNARNEGAKIAESELIAVTDADCLVEKNWLELIYNNFKDKEIIAVGGDDYPRSKSIKARFFYWLLRKLTHFFIFSFNFAALGGTNCAFRKNEFLKIGGFNENLPYVEDADIGFRIKKLGKVYRDKKVKVFTSTRRFEKNGYIKVMSSWFIGSFKLMMNIPIKGVRYHKGSGYKY